MGSQSNLQYSKTKRIKMVRLVGLVLVIMVAAGYLLITLFTTVTKQENAQNSTPTRSTTEYDARQDAKQEAYLNDLANLKVEEGQDDSAILWTQLVAFYGAGDYERAIASGLKLSANADYVNDISLYIYLADSYKALGQTDEETRMIKKVIEIAESTPGTIEDSALREYRDRL